MKHFFIFIQILFVFSAAAQKTQDDTERFKELFSKTENYYKNTEAYSLEVLYQFFEDGKHLEATETMSGAISKKGDNYYSKIGPTETIFLEDSYLKINHDEKAVLYSKTQDKKGATPVEVTSMLGFFEEIQIMEKNGNYVCDLSFKKIDIMPYKKMVIVIDADTYAIKKQELYMHAGKSYPGMTAGNQKTVAGKMVITFSAMTKKEGVSSHFKKSNYLIEGNELTLSNNLASYKLYDTTQ